MGQNCRVFFFFWLKKWSVSIFRAIRLCLFIYSLLESFYFLYLWVCSIIFDMKSLTSAQNVMLLHTIIEYLGEKVWLKPLFCEMVGVTQACGCKQPILCRFSLSKEALKLLWKKRRDLVWKFDVWNQIKLSLVLRFMWV